MDYQIGKEIEKAIAKIDNCIGHSYEPAIPKLEDTIDALKRVRELLEYIINE